MVKAQNELRGRLGGGDDGPLLFFALDQCDALFVHERPCNPTYLVNQLPPAEFLFLSMVAWTFDLKPKRDRADLSSADDVEAFFRGVVRDALVL